MVSMEREFGIRFEEEYWLGVAELMFQMASSCRSDQAFLVKVDGLRPMDSTYTVLVDGPQGRGVSFREDSGDLRSSMASALERAPPIQSKIKAGHDLVNVAKLLACLDALAVSGVFVGIGLSAGSGTGLIEVSMAGPVLGDEFFVRESDDLVSLLGQAVAFYQRNTLHDGRPRA